MTMKKKSELRRNVWTSMERDYEFELTLTTNLLVS